MRHRFSGGSGRGFAGPVICAGGLALLLPIALLADDDPVFRIEMKDGVVTPQRLEVPAGRQIILELANIGSEPAEFESRELKREVGLFPGSHGRLIIRKLDPGEYHFFDDFHPGSAEAVLIAK
jgi:hypothetical protein